MMAFGMYGIYLECDRCHIVTLGGEQVTANPEKPLNNAQGQELRRRAGQRGWRMLHVEATNQWYDCCPKCAEEGLPV